MADQRGSFLHIGVAPDIDLVLRVAVGGYDFMEGLTESDVADLGSGVFFAHDFTGKNVSHFDHAVGGASAGGKQAVLVGGPGESLDGSFVVGKFIDDVSSGAPDGHFVIVSS